VPRADERFVGAAVVAGLLVAFTALFIWLL